MLFDNENDLLPHKIDEGVREHVIKGVKAEKQKIELNKGDSKAKVHSEYKT